MNPPMSSRYSSIRNGRRWGRCNDRSDTDNHLALPWWTIDSTYSLRVIALLSHSLLPVSLPLLERSLKHTSTSSYYPSPFSINITILPRSFCKITIKALNDHQTLTLSRNPKLIDKNRRHNTDSVFAVSDLTRISSSEGSLTWSWIYYHSLWLKPSSQPFSSLYPSWSHTLLPFQPWTAHLFNIVTIRSPFSNLILFPPLFRQWMINQFLK